MLNCLVVLVMLACTAVQAQLDVGPSLTREQMIEEHNAFLKRKAERVKELEQKNELVKQKLEKTKSGITVLPRKRKQDVKPSSTNEVREATEMSGSNISSKERLRMIVFRFITVVCVIFVVLIILIQLKKRNGKGK